jgi:tetratricopeptide (TPR) repeat protein
MKFKFICLLVLAFQFKIFAQNATLHYKYVYKADSLLKLNLYKKAFETYKTSLTYFTRNCDVYISMADILLRENKETVADKYLIKAISNGATIGPLFNFELIKKYFDKKKKWFNIYNLENQKYVSKIPHHAERILLIRMLEKDQSFRELLGALDFKKVDSIIHINDIYNLRQFKKILANIGFPDNNKVGVDGSDAVFILLLHLLNTGVNDEENGKAIFPLIENSVKKGFFPPFYYAMLVDRQKGLKQQPQVFGTYWENKNGKKQITAIEDVKLVEQRRSSIGLPSLSSVIKEQNLVPPNNYTNQ